MPFDFALLGRALRLMLMNAVNSRPGKLDRSTLGQPGKYTYCIAEDEAQSPWAPLHVERGYDGGQSTVTVMAADSRIGRVSIACVPSFASQLLPEILNRFAAEHPQVHITVEDDTAQVAGAVENAIKAAGYETAPA